MNIQLSEEHLMIQKAARDFAQNELKPGVIERDEKQQFPAEQIKMLGELGFMGMMVDPKYGGSGMDTLSYVLVMEELSKIDASVSVAVSVNNSLVCWGLETFANEEQKPAKILIPTSSILTVNGKKTVFIVGAGSKATEQIIKTGAIFGEFTEVKQGLMPGTSLIISPIEKLSSGSSITIEKE
jgi:hypothetical protein